MSNNSQRADFPDRKLSETFLHFAEPLLEPLGADATEQQMEEVLKIAFTVWNAVVYEAAKGETRFLDMVQKATASVPPVATFVEEMIARKRKLFGDDQRLIGKYEFFRKNGELRFRAEARSPWSASPPTDNA